MSSLQMSSQEGNFLTGQLKQNNGYAVYPRKYIMHVRGFQVA